MTEPVCASQPHHARRFSAASSSDDAKAQSAPGPTAGPALKGISSTSLAFQRARARDRLAPYPPGFRIARPLGDSRSDLMICPGSSLPVHITTPAWPTFRRPERPRKGQAKRKVGRFSGRERGQKDFPALSTWGALEEQGNFTSNPPPVQQAPQAGVQLQSLKPDARHRVTVASASLIWASLIRERRSDNVPPADLYRPAAARAVHI